MHPFSLFSLFLEEEEKLDSVAILGQFVYGSMFCVVRPVDTTTAASGSRRVTSRRVYCVLDHVPRLTHTLVVRA